MRRTAATLLALLLAAAAGAPTLAQEPAPVPKEVYSTTRVLVQFEPNKVFPMAENDLGIQYDSTVGDSTLRYTITDSSSVGAKVEQLSKVAGVKAAGPDFRVFLQDWTPNDPRFAEQWHLAKVQAPKAWDTTTGSPEVRVCVVDSGARMDHPDLARNIIKGYNLVPADQSNPNNQPPAATDPVYQNYNDTLGHGTHVAGTIAALANNSIGVAGAAPNVKLVICRFIWDDGSGYISDAINCLKLCRDDGALIASNSWGGIAYSDFLNGEIQGAADAGQLFVVAAGNNGQNMDKAPLYPASLQLANVVSVASTNGDDVVSGFSNYGKGTIDLCAPGEAILSTTYDGGYGLMWGTSMATPIVTAAAALAQSAAKMAGKTLAYGDLKKYLTSGTVDTDGGNCASNVKTGRLNIAKVVAAVAKDFPAYSPPPPPPSPPPPTPPPPPPRTVGCGTSLAKGRPAFQSSTVEGRPASLAVDGSCSTNPSTAPYCAQTAPTDRNPFWYVDLGKAVIVKTVLITTRTDVDWQALGGTQVLVGNDTWVDAGSSAAFTLCGSVEGAFGSNNPRQPVYCAGGAGIAGRYVVLFHPNTQQQLTLCEVDVVLDELSLTDNGGSFSANRRRLAGAGAALDGGGSAPRRRYRWQPWDDEHSS